MAVALDCQGNTSSAEHYLLAATTRQEFPPTDELDSEGGVRYGPLNPVDVLDTSQGATLTLPNLKYPQTVVAGKAMFEAYQKLSEAQVPATAQAQQLLIADQSKLNALLRRENTPTAQRTSEILGEIQSAISDPDIASLSDKAYELDVQVRLMASQTEGTAGCTDHGAAQGKWLSTVTAFDAAQRTFMAALYRRQTALAANLKDAAAHQIAMDDASESIPGNFAALVSAGHAFTTYDFSCATSNPPAVNPESGSAVEPPSKACPTGLSAPNFSINLVVLSFSVTCEELTIEAEGGEGWLNVFVSFSHNFRTGSTTVFGGPEVGAKVPIGPFSGGVTARGGVYLTFGADGTVQDLGVRGETSASVSVQQTTAANLWPRGQPQLCRCSNAVFIVERTTIVCRLGQPVDGGITGRHDNGFRCVAPGGRYRCVCGRDFEVGALGTGRPGIRECGGTSSRRSPTVTIKQLLPSLLAVAGTTCNRSRLSSVYWT